MDIETLGNPGEFIGSIAVLVALVYIAVQTRQTMTANLSAHVQDAYIQFRAGLINREVWEAEQSVLRTCLCQPGFLDWWEHGQQSVTPEFSRLMETCSKPKMVLYDPEGQSWSRPEGGLFAQDASNAIRDLG